MKKIRIFLSYAHKDSALKEELELHLSPLKRADMIELWEDNQINPGEEWDQVIRDSLERADVIVLLVSPAFVASKYIWENELKRAMERRKEGKVAVVPVFLKAVVFEDLPFAGIQGLPRDARPVTEYPSQDRGFYEVAKGLRELALLLSARAE